MKKFLIVFYFVFLIFVAICSYLFIDPNFSYLQNIYSGFSYKHRLETTIIYILTVFLSFLFYFLFLKYIKNNYFSSKKFGLIILITALILLFSYPAMLSYDIFNYIATSKVLFFYQENPYIIMPIEFVGDPLLSFTHAANKIALYGPSWILMSGIPFLFGFSNFILILFNFKLLISLFYIGTIFLIWKMTNRLVSIGLFAFNPLVVLETLVSGHNDIVMIFFALLSFILLMKNKIKLSVLFFLLSVFIKYATIVLLPIFVYVFFKKLKNESINWGKVYFYSALAMFFGFLMSPLREEIYPWYAIWFLSFSFLIPQRKFLLAISISLSLGLLLRYIPFMLTGIYDDKTSIIKTILTFIFPLGVVFFYLFKEKLWLKIFTR